jgi:hypothetical protein
LTMGEAGWGVPAMRKFRGAPGACADRELLRRRGRPSNCHMSDLRLISKFTIHLNSQDPWQTVVDPSLLLARILVSVRDTGACNTTVLQLIRCRSGAKPLG